MKSARSGREHAQWRGAAKASAPSLRRAGTWQNVLLASALALSGCMGTALDFPSNVAGGGSGGTGGSGGGNSPNPNPGTNDPTERPVVVLPTAQVKLLPFDVRLRRIADGVGIAVSDKVFDTARASKFALGAHDFANGTSPDLSWNTQRMSVWIEAMLPVCRDSRVKTKLGDWKQGGVDKFIQSAFGRAAVAGDTDDLAPVLAISGDDGWLLGCLALVSSAEVLLQ